jgi:capsular polysaccharide biosynthesis protein
MRNGSRDPRRAGDRVRPLAAVIRHPFLTAIPLIIAVAGALYWAGGQAATYTAEARLFVGRMDVEATAQPGFTAASQSLAGSYARLVGTSEHRAITAERLGVTPEQLRGELDGSPVPESAVIRIQATAPDEETAIRRADAAAQGLMDYVRTLLDSSERGERLLDRYLEAARELSVATTARNQYAAEIAALRGMPPPEPGSEDIAVPAAAGAPMTPQLAGLLEQYAIASAEVQRLQLQAETIANQYRDSQRGLESPDAIRPISAASSLGSDRSATLQVALLAALLLGGLIGAALATARANGLFSRPPSPRPLPTEPRTEVIRPRQSVRS